MLSIQNGNISLTRGDSASLKINITASGGEVYLIGEGDHVVFTMRRAVKNSAGDGDFVIQKESEEAEVKLLPEDTENLDYGEYLYDVELRTAAGDVYTVLPIHKFTLTEEVS